MACRKEILFQRWNHFTNKYIFWGPQEILFFGRDIKIGETFDEVYRVERWLYWKIKFLFIKKPLFDSKSHALIDPPVGKGIQKYIHVEPEYIKFIHLRPKIGNMNLNLAAIVSATLDLGNGFLYVNVEPESMKFTSFAPHDRQHWFNFCYLVQYLMV